MNVIVAADQNWELVRTTSFCKYSGRYEDAVKKQVEK